MSSIEGRPVEPPEDDGPTGGVELGLGPPSPVGGPGASLIWLPGRSGTYSRVRPEPVDAFGFRVEDMELDLVFEIRYPIDKPECIFVRLLGEGNSWNLVRRVPSAGQMTIWFDIWCAGCEVVDKAERIGEEPWIARLKELYEELKAKGPANEDEDGFEVVNDEYEVVSISKVEVPDESQVIDKRSGEEWTVMGDLTDQLRRRLEDDENGRWFG